MAVDFTTFSDNAIVLPDPSNGDIDTDIQFNTPGVDGTKAGVLSFRVNPAGTLPTLRVEINGTTVLTQTYGNNVERTVQENFNQSILNANNELTLQVTGNGSASMSDFLVLYKTV
jgi:hypothetical protein